MGKDRIADLIQTLEHQKADADGYATQQANKQYTPEARAALDAAVDVARARGVNDHKKIQPTSPDIMGSAINVALAVTDSYKGRH